MATVVRPVGSRENLLGIFVGRTEKSVGKAGAEFESGERGGGGVDNDDPVEAIFKPEKEGEKESEESFGGSKAVGGETVEVVEVDVFLFETG